MKSNKMVPKMLLKCVKNDTRLITGANIRKLLILTKKDNIDSISAKDIDDIEYEEIFSEDLWRSNVIKELTDVKFDQLNVEGFSDEEFKEILHYACTSWFPSDFFTPLPLSVVFLVGFSPFHNK